MKIRTRVAFALTAAAATVALVPSPAAAGPNEDFQAVLADYIPDRDIFSCRFTKTQLENAIAVADASLDAAYYGTAFQDEARAEIARHDRGECNVKTAGQTGVAAFQAIYGKGARLRITKVRARGRGRTEQVVVKNIGSRSIQLAGLRLVSNSRQSIKYPRYRLARGRSFRVINGCPKVRRPKKGRRAKKPRRTRKRATLFACRRKGFMRDTSDVIRLTRNGGSTAFSQYGYGSFRRLARF